MKNDKKIKELIAVIKTKREKLGPRPQGHWETNALFKEGTNNINLNVVTDSSILILMASLLLFASEGHDKACEFLELEEEFKHDGYSLESWLTDLKFCVSKIKYNKEKAELDAFDKKLANLISEEAKTELELEDIEKLLK